MDGLRVYCGDFIEFVKEVLHDLLDVRNGDPDFSLESNTQKVYW
jgi:hypothetical protein